ncbi:MAG TPA: LytTR family DNA-binding domain-containing protein [Bryobacteraceae bacterium]|nr:LytTR family DNA-binding domain-containing protein [Bryobacteraceae bacterium]
MPMQSSRVLGQVSGMAAGALNYPLDTARQERPQPVRAPSEPALAAGLRKIVGRSGEEYVLLNPEDVLAFQAERELVWIVTAGRRYLATQTLSHIESRLDGTAFRRIHRNALVNLNHVRRMSPLSSQRWLLTLSNGHELTVSKRLAHTVRRMLQW